MSYLRLHTAILMFAALTAAGCSSARPQMSVLGVKTPKIQRFEKPLLKVFVEVHNPTSRVLNLSRLEYRFAAENWFDIRGKVPVRRNVPPGASSVVEINVPVAERAAGSSLRGVPYKLDALLFAVSDKTERSWKLNTKGALTIGRGNQIRVAQVSEASR